MSPVMHQLAVDTVRDRESGVRAGRVTPPNRPFLEPSVRRRSRVWGGVRAFRHSPSDCRAACPSSTGGSSCSNLSTQEASKREPSCFPCSFRPTASTMANRVPTAHTIRELSPRTLPDFETLAAKQGGCWCIFYQRAKPLRRGTTSEEWKRRNRRDKRRLGREGRSHAILVYDGKTAIGWCQYGGRNQVPPNERGGAQPQGGAPVWGGEVRGDNCLL